MRERESDPELAVRVCCSAAKVYIHMHEARDENENEYKSTCERRFVVIVNVPVKVRADLVRAASLDGVALSTTGLEETSSLLGVT